MKYIKSFESTIEDEPIITKKYILVKDKKDIHAYILEIYNVSNTLINFKQLYYLDNDHLTQNRHKPNHMTIKELFKYNSIIYQSDNLQDCIDLMKTLINSIKYNL
jgi:hypothetical protein